MNNKLMIFVEIPLIEKELNIMIPLNKKIGNIIIELVKYVNDNMANEELQGDSFSLFDKDTGKIIPNNNYVKNSNLYNGQVLILM